MKLLPRKKNTDEICWCKIQSTVVEIISIIVMALIVVAILSLMVLGGLQVGHDVGLVDLGDLIIYCVGFWIVMPTAIGLTVASAWGVFLIIIIVLKFLWNTFWSFVSKGQISNGKCKN